MAPVTFLSDFGTRDAYVAEVKGVLLSLAPDAHLVDISHEIAPGDVRAASFICSRVWRRFPAGTVHLAVVDPGVGTERRALAAAAEGHAFVAPDNGILSFLPENARYVELAIPEGASPTFHGRDVFAPAAARLARGALLADLGRFITDPRRLPHDPARSDDGAWVGTVVYVDRFGTLITDLRAEVLVPGARLMVAGRDAGPVRRTFGDVDVGALVAFTGSGGTIEIAARGGNAAAVLGVGVGAEVRAAAGEERP